MIKVGIPAQNQESEKFGVNTNYLEWIYNFGRPVIILPETYDNYKEIYKIDALVLPGGADVNPKKYSRVPSFGTLQPNIYLEHFDDNILPNLIGNIPIFGICRGLQTLNVHFGGTLRNLWGHPYSSYDGNEVHYVWKPEIVNKDKKNFFMRVNSFHHQGIAKLARNFNTELIDSDDNVIECISDLRSRIVAVQWHPERLFDNYSVSAFNQILK